MSKVSTISTISPAFKKKIDDAVKAGRKAAKKSRFFKEAGEAQERILREVVPSQVIESHLNMDNQKKFAKRFNGTKFSKVDDVYMSASQQDDLASKMHRERIKANRQRMQVDSSDALLSSMRQNKPDYSGIRKANIEAKAESKIQESAEPKILQESSAQKISNGMKGMPNRNSSNTGGVAANFTNAKAKATEKAAVQGDKTIFGLTGKQVLGTAVGGGLIFSMFNRGGKMSNSELYGQSSPYGY